MGEAAGVMRTGASRTPRGRSAGEPRRLDRGGKSHRIRSWIAQAQPRGAEISLLKTLCWSNKIHLQA